MRLVQNKCARLPAHCAVRTAAADNAQHCRAGERRRSLARSSRESLEDLDELVGPIALGACEAKQLPRSLDDGAALGGAADGYPAAAAKLEQAFVSELPEGAQHGVRVDAEYSGEVLRRWQTLSRAGFAVGDRASNLGRDLFMEIGRVIAMVLASIAPSDDTHLASSEHCDG